MSDIHTIIDIERIEFEDGHVNCQLCDDPLKVGVHICLQTAPNVASYGMIPSCANICDDCATRIGEAAIPSAVGSRLRTMLEVARE